MRIFWLLFLIISIYSNILFGQHYTTPLIPANNRVDWTTAGLTIDRPVEFNLIIDVVQQFNVIPGGDATNNTSNLIKAIEFARNYQGWKAIFFSQPGVYNFNGTIQLTTADNNTIIKGIGSDKVTLYFEMGFPLVKDCFNISGSSFGNSTQIGTSFKNDDVITLANERSDINNGDWITLSDHRLDNTDYKTWAFAGQVIQIKEKLNSTQYRLTDKLSLDYPSNNDPYIQKFLPSQNIGFEDFKIQRSGNDGASNGGRNFGFHNAINCWLYGIESYGTQSWHVDISLSSHIFVHGCFFHHANAYGNPDGTGYGVVVNDRSTNCLVENNIFNYLRHAMLVQSSANRNVYAFNFVIMMPIYYNGFGRPIQLADLLI